MKRKNIISEMIRAEEQYTKDLDVIKYRFIQPIRESDPPIIPQQNLESFIADVFGNLFDLRCIHKRLLEAMYTRQPGQIGTIFRFN
jgi:RHO1 GDP-GTP exchange protein 1/2